MRKGVFIIIQISKMFEAKVYKLPSSIFLEIGKHDTCRVIRSVIKCKISHIVDLTKTRWESGAGELAARFRRLCRNGLIAHHDRPAIVGVRFTKRCGSVGNTVGINWCLIGVLLVCEDFGSEGCVVDVDGGAPLVGREVGRRHARGEEGGGSIGSGEGFRLHSGTGHVVVEAVTAVGAFWPRQALRVSVKK